ncbi:MAG: L,D-transpeptidase family protein [Pseudorhodoplanes sp.]|nr:L,D-transpeptidase family protein [Pseudorhodoplanes sp.]
MIAIDPRDDERNFRPVPRAPLANPYDARSDIAPYPAISSAPTAAPYDMRNRQAIQEEALPTPNSGANPAAYPPVYSARPPAGMPAHSQPFGSPSYPPAVYGTRPYDSIEDDQDLVTGAVRPPASILPSRSGSVAALPAEDQPETGEPKELPPQFKRQIVPYPTREPAGTIIIDTQNTYLYYVLGGGQAIRYGIGVGREGFTWAGIEKISRLAEWPDWHPPSEMIERQPYLPRFMAGGPGNPLGARALYLGKTVYRIHGTNQPSTIGQFVSSGCIRLLNEDVEDLYNRVKVGTKVVVLPGSAPSASNAAVVR